MPDDEYEFFFELWEDWKDIFYWCIENFKLHTWYVEQYWTDRQSHHCQMRFVFSKVEDATYFKLMWL